MIPNLFTSTVGTLLFARAYAPQERYGSERELGRYTDICALPALCWRAITGELPAESPYRHRLTIIGDGGPLPLLAETRPAGYSDALLRAVEWLGARGEFWPPPDSPDMSSEADRRPLRVGRQKR